MRHSIVLELSTRRAIARYGTVRNSSEHVRAPRKIDTFDRPMPWRRQLESALHRIVSAAPLISMIVAPSLITINPSATMGPSLMGLACAAGQPPANSSNGESSCATRTPTGRSVCSCSRCSPGQRVCLHAQPEIKWTATLRP